MPIKGSILLLILAAFLLGGLGGYTVGVITGWPNPQVARLLDGLRPAHPRVSNAYNRAVKTTLQMVSGKVTTIRGNLVTIKDGSDFLTFKVGQEVKPVRLLPPPLAPSPEATAGGKAPEPAKMEEVTLADLKIGDAVNANVSLGVEGLTATSLAIVAEGVAVE